MADQELTCIKSTHTPKHTLWVSSCIVLIQDGQVFADGRLDEKISAENLKKLYRVCVCVAHSETGVSAFVPTGTQ